MNQYFHGFIIAICLHTGPIEASDEQTKIENEAFKEAVQAVKDKNYGHAIRLFEVQAKLSRHQLLRFSVHPRALFLPPASALRHARRAGWPRANHLGM